MTRRRDLLLAAPGAALLAAASGLWPKPASAQPAGDWGGPQGYPTGWGPPGQPPRWEGYPAYRAGNYSGGFETMFRHHRITAPAQASPLSAAPKAVRYRVGLMTRGMTDYLDQWPVTGLLIARQGQVWAEHYRFGRDASMRLTSWSMAKSVTSLLVGIALDQGLIRSLDDLPQDYVPELQGTLHGQVPLRHLLNMSSGADVVHERDPVRIDVPALLGWPQARTLGTDVNRVVREWRGTLEAPGVRYNYNELCPLTLGMVLRAVSGGSLAQFAQTRDWARLGQLVAQQGEMQGRQIVSKAWLADCASHGV